MKTKFRRLFILLLTVAVRVFWLTRFTPDPIAPVDAEGYHLLAVNVLAGRGFAIGWDPPFCPTAIRPPLYPLFLMGSYLLLGVNPRVVILLQVLLEALTTACIMRLGDEIERWRACQKPMQVGQGLLTAAPLSVGRGLPTEALATEASTVGTVAGLLYALNGSTQRYVGFLFAEMLLLPLMTWALWATVRVLGYQHCDCSCIGCQGCRCTKERPGLFAVIATAAIFWGLALLAKPNIQFLILAVGWLLLLGNGGGLKGFLRGLVGFWGILALVLSPWLVRNRLVLGRWMLSTAFEENLARVSAVATLAEVQDVRVEPWTETWEYLYDQIVSTAATQYGWRATQNNVPYCVQQNQHRRQIVAVARDIVKSYPGAFLMSHLRGVSLSLLDPGHRLWYKALTGREWETTGVVENIWERMAWSLKRHAVGDALHAFWLERVTCPPLAAVLIWWGLALARIGVGWLSVRGLWRLRRNLPTLLVLAGTVGYALTLAGPIAHDRFYLPTVPVVVTLMALGVHATVCKFLPLCFTERL